MAEGTDGGGATQITDRTELRHPRRLPCSACRNYFAYRKEPPPRPVITRFSYAEDDDNCCSSSRNCTLALAQQNRQKQQWHRLTSSRSSASCPPVRCVPYSGTSSGYNANEQQTNRRRSRTPSSRWASRTADSSPTSRCIRPSLRRARRALLARHSLLR